MKVGAAMESGTDYEEFPMIKQKDYSAYVPVRALIYMCETQPPASIG